jgi:hypothetical protein
MAAAGGEVVEFGWEDAEAKKPISGRRKKAIKEQKKKNKSGTFGKQLHDSSGWADFGCTVNMSATSGCSCSGNQQPPRHLYRSVCYKMVYIWRRAGACSQNRSIAGVSQLVCSHCWLLKQHDVSNACCTQVSGCVSFAAA